MPPSQGQGQGQGAGLSELRLPALPRERTQPALSTERAVTYSDDPLGQLPIGEVVIYDSERLAERIAVL